jgi:hypothetical protein
VSNDPTVLVFGTVVALRPEPPLFTRRRIVIGAASLVLLSALALLVGSQAHFGAKTHAVGSAPPIKVAHSRSPAVMKAAISSSDQPHAIRTSSRVVDAAQAANLFAPHSWHVDPPPPPPAPPLPPAPPTAPPFPYAFIGTYTSGDTTTYFLSRADRVVDAHIGDRLDGTYDFESADANQLTFNYLPLNIRQSLSSGGNP